MKPHEYKPAPSDAELNAALPEAPPPRSPHCQAELRAARVLDYQLEANDKPDPLEATLAALNGGLIEITGDVERFIRSRLGEEATNPETLERLRSAFDTYFRALRQIDRFSQFEQRRVESRQRAADNHRDPLRDFSQFAGLGKRRKGM